MDFAVDRRELGAAGVRARRVARGAFSARISRGVPPRARTPIEAVARVARSSSGLHRAPRRTGSHVRRAVVDAGRRSDAPTPCADNVGILTDETKVKNAS